MFLIVLTIVIIILVVTFFVVEEFLVNAVSSARAKVAIKSVTTSILLGVLWLVGEIEATTFKRPGLAEIIAMMCALVFFYLGRIAPLFSAQAKKEIALNGHYFLVGFFGLLFLLILYQIGMHSLIRQEIKIPHDANQLVAVLFMSMIFCLPYIFFMIKERQRIENENSA